jgi:Tetratricopeptide repeat.
LAHIAALLGKLQHYEEAIASYDRALAIKATDSEIWHNRGAMLGKIEQYAAAVDSYDRALAFNPSRYETWYNRGNMLWRLLRYSDAIDSYDRALRIRPTNTKFGTIERCARKNAAISRIDRMLRQSNSP